MEFKDVIFEFEISIYNITDEIFLSLYDSVTNKTKNIFSL